MGFDSINDYFSDQLVRSIAQSNWSEVSDRGCIGALKDKTEEGGVGFFRDPIFLENFATEGLDFFTNCNPKFLKEKGM